MSYTEAIKLLPKTAVWSCSFGLPIDVGYVEYYRDTASPRRWNVVKSAAGFHVNQIGDAR